MTPAPPDLEGWSSFDKPLSFAVVGLGGAGSEAVHDLLGLEIPGVRPVAINTDAAHLDRMPIEERILIGHRELRGRGSGGNRPAVLRAAEESREEILRRLRTHEVVFLLAALGGGTGSTLLPYLVRELRQTDTLAIPVAFLPFNVELLASSGRREHVEETLSELEEMGGLLLVLSNERLRRFEALPIHQVLRVRNAYLHSLVTSLVDMVQHPSQLNVDLASVRHHLANSGLSTLIFSEQHFSEPEKLVRQALRESLLDFELGARPRALVHIQGGSNLTLRAFAQILDVLRTDLGDPEEMVFGTRLGEEPQELVRLTGVISGIKPRQIVGPIGRSGEPIPAR